MGLKAAVQALKKAEVLKDKIQRCKDLLNDNDAWICRQQLQKIYQQVLILDLEYALDKKVEQELWNLGFKNYIATLQSQAKDKKNPKRGESQALLSWCLEAASGFYLTLLQEICTAFDLDLPFRRKGYVYGCTSPWKAVEKLSVPHKSSCFYACQYCLVHLGDIARYRNENKQAELFYRHAVSLSPSSGQPYNQLALLEASRGDKLGTVFHYARSVAVKHPFPVATANLSKTLSSALNDNSFNINGKTKLNAQEYITVFLKLHGILHNLGDLEKASSYVKLLTETLTALVATESFNSWRLVQMLVINLYALQHVAGATTDNAELLKREQLSTDETIARDYILDLIAGSLSALLLPVYTIKNSIVEYFALPSIKLCLEWIRIKPTVLEETAFISRLQIWPSLCLLLNSLQSCVTDFNCDQYNKVPLPEDRDLQGFLPLEKSFEHLRFTNTELEGDNATLNKLRAVRILQLGHYLAQRQINGSSLISVTAVEKKFVCTSETAGPSNELMKELEELSLNKDKQPTTTASPVLSESLNNKGPTEPDIPEMEKRIGILKPQGSLERNRDTAVCANTENTNIELNVLPSTRKPRQNVAMQAIMRRAENEQKQVTFKNVSPVIVEEENEKKVKAVLPSPIKVNGNNKSASSTGEMSAASVISNQATQITVQSRQSLTPGGGTNLPPAFTQTTVPGQHTSVQEQPKTMNLQLNIPQLSQVTQSQIKDPNLALSQFRQQAQALPPICYQNQSFNVQNPQFAKHFMTSLQQVPATSVQPYPIPGQFNGVPQVAPQNVSMQPNTNQNRPLHQRMTQSVPQSQLMQHGITSTSSTQQNHHLLPSSPHNISISQTMPLGQLGINMQQPNINMSQQNHNLSLQQQRMGLQTSLKTNGVSPHNPANVNGTNIANNLSVMPTMSPYQKNLEHITSVAANSTSASLSPTSMSNFQLNFNQNYGQSAFNHLPQKQLSPTIYGKSSMEFPFPSQNTVGKNPQPTSNNYPMFQGYDAQEFALWKDTQPPQLPVTWWNTVATAGTTQIHTKDTSAADAFKNWGNPPNPGNMVNRVPLTPGNNYQQNPLQGRQYNVRNNFEDPRSFEVDQKANQPSTTGNTYSLFSGNAWTAGPQSSNASSQDQMKSKLNQQSLWSGPGPSPLERLLEQQKSLREGGT